MFGKFKNNNDGMPAMGMNHDDAIDGSEEQTRRPQFGLRRLMIAVTLLCILLVLPGGIILFVWLGGWAVVAVLVIGALLLLQWPLYFLMKKVADSDETSHR